MASRHFIETRHSHTKVEQLLLLVPSRNNCKIEVFSITYFLFLTHLFNDPHFLTSDTNVYLKYFSYLTFYKPWSL